MTGSASDDEFVVVVIVLGFVAGRAEDEPDGVLTHLEHGDPCGREGGCDVARHGDVVEPDHR